MVISHPIQHFVPVFRELARRPEFHVKVFYACDWGVKPYHDPGFNRSFAWDVDLLAGYEYEMLPIAERPRHMGFWEVDAPAINQSLDTFRPHAVWLHGYGQRVCWRAAAWAKHRAAALHFGDSELVRTRSLWRRSVKEGFLRWYFGRRCDAFISIGDNNDAYYRHYGVPRSRIFRGACPIDVDRFRRAIRSSGRPSRADIRKKHGFGPSDLVALWVGKFEPHKRPDDFAMAIKALSGENTPVLGLMVGDGPLRERIQSQVRDMGLAHDLRIAGFINQEELPLTFEAADVYVTTSEVDAHPLTVTEGMAVGLPVIASDKVGCIGPTDTARPGINALVYPCGNVGRLADCLKEVAADSDLRARLGRKSYEIATGQGPDTTVRAILQSLIFLRSQDKYDWTDISGETWRQIHAGT